MTGCTDALLATVRREVEQRRAAVDAASDLGEVTIRIRFHPGTTSIKTVIWEEERIYRRLSPMQKEARDTVRP